MRRRPRIDLGQETSSKEETNLNRKRQRWSDRNKERPNENPFLKAISPDQDLFGEPDERAEELRKRLSNLEFGNFPGYFNYRKKSAPDNKNGQPNGNKDKNSSDQANTSDQTNNVKDDNHGSQKDSASCSLDAGLSDERISSLKREWFARKSVLDIGCNRGHITYAIARLFSPKFIVGIDIDVKMINMANRDLHLHIEDCIIKNSIELRQQQAAKLKLRVADDDNKSYVEVPNQFPLANYIDYGPLIVEQQKEDGGDESKAFPNNIVFVEHNYVLSRDDLLYNQKPHFDTIVCLSVTKWIHLNYRDEGLKRFFKRVYRHLNPNGLFIIEAQPFDNYGRRKRLSDRLKANYYSIKFKPDMFDAYLLSEEVGFRQIIQETTTEHECIGFKRPLKVFLK